MVSLSEAMGINALPDVEEARWVHEYHVLVETGQDQTEQAQVLMAKIVGAFGAHHLVVERLETLQRFQEFKRSRNLV